MVLGLVKYHTSTPIPHLIIDVTSPFISHTSTCFKCHDAGFPQDLQCKPVRGYRKTFDNTIDLVSGDDATNAGMFPVEAQPIPCLRSILFTISACICLLVKEKKNNDRLGIPV